MSGKTNIKTNKKNKYYWDMERNKPFTRNH